MYSILYLLFNLGNIFFFCKKKEEKKRLCQIMKNEFIRVGTECKVLTNTTMTKKKFALYIIILTFIVDSSSQLYYKLFFNYFKYTLYIIQHALCRFFFCISISFRQPLHIDFYCIRIFTFLVCLS